MRHHKLPHPRVRGRRRHDLGGLGVVDPPSPLASGVDFEPAEAWGSRQRVVILHEGNLRWIPGRGECARRTARMQSSKATPPCSCATASVEGAPPLGQARPVEQAGNVTQLPSTLRAPPCERRARHHRRMPTAKAIRPPTIRGTSEQSSARAAPEPLGSKHVQRGSAARGARAAKTHRRPAPKAPRRPTGSGGIGGAQRAQRARTARAPGVN